MKDATVSWDAVNFRAVGDVNIFNGQGIKDFGAGSSADSVGQIVVTDEEEDGDTTGGQAINAFGKLPLLSLARLAALIGITAEENQVYPVFQGIIYHLVEGGDKVKEARG